MLTLKDVTQGEGVKSTRYTCNKMVELAGDSIYDCTLTEVTVTEVVLEEMDWGDSVGRYVYVYYTVNGQTAYKDSWTVYTDTGFEAAVSELLGEELCFTEQGEQEDGRACME